MLNVIKNVSSTLAYNNISKIQTSQHALSALSSGIRINAASDDAFSPSVRVTFSPEAMALQRTTTQGTNSLPDANSPSAKAVIDLGTPPTSIKDLQIAKSPSLDHLLAQENVPQEVMQLQK